MAAEPAPPGGTAMHALQLHAQWEPEKSQNRMEEKEHSRNEVCEVRKHRFRMKHVQDPSMRIKKNLFIPTLKMRLHTDHPKIR